MFNRFNDRNQQRFNRKRLRSNRRRKRLSRMRKKRESSILEQNTLQKKNKKRTTNYEFELTWTPDSAPLFNLGWDSEVNFKIYGPPNAQGTKQLLFNLAAQGGINGYFNNNAGLWIADHKKGNPMTKILNFSETGTYTITGEDSVSDGWHGSNLSIKPKNAARDGIQDFKINFSLLHPDESMYQNVKTFDIERMTGTTTDPTQDVGVVVGTTTDPTVAVPEAKAPFQLPVYTTAEMLAITEPKNGMMVLHEYGIIYIFRPQNQLPTNRTYDAWHAIAGDYNLLFTLHGAILTNSGPWYPDMPDGWDITIEL